MKLLNSLIKKIKSNRKAGIVIAAAVIILMILGIFIIKGDTSKKTINEKLKSYDKKLNAVITVENPFV